MMGMFDWVTVPPLRCPVCQSRLDGWQSKDGPGVHRLMATVPYDQTDECHTVCRQCQTWVRLVLRRPRTVGLADFEMRVRPVGDFHTPEAVYDAAQWLDPSAVQQDMEAEDEA